MTSFAYFPLCSENKVSYLNPLCLGNYHGVQGAEHADFTLFLERNR